MNARRAALAIFLVALALRLAVTLALPSFRAVYPDTLSYDEIAHHLVAGEGFRDDDDDRASRLPGYPLFMAAHRALFGDSYLPIRITQALLGALTCLLLWRLARPILGEGPALSAAAVTAVYPLLVVSSTLLLIEPLYGFLLMLEVALLRSAAETGRRGRAAAAGLAGGAATLIQAGHALLFVFLLPLAAWTSCRRGRIAIVLTFLAGTAFLPGVWTARNWVVLHAFVPFSTHSGMAVYGSLADVGRAGWQETAASKEDLEEVERNQANLRTGIESARRNRMKILRRAITKQQHFWNFVPNFFGYRNWRVATLTVPFLPVLLLFLIGLWRLPRSNPASLWLLAPIVYTAAVHFFIFGSIRYRLPVEPFLIAFATGTAWGLARAWRSRRRPSSPPEVSPAA